MRLDLQVCMTTPPPLGPDASRPHRTQVCVTTPPPLGPDASRPHRTQVCVTTPPPLGPDGSRPQVCVTTPPYLCVYYQVHRLLSELYGNYVISKYVSPKTPRLSGPPTPKAPRLSDPPTHTVPQLCDPPPRTPPHLESSIVLRVRKKFRKKAEVEGVSPSGDGSSGESFTKFVLWKRNLVRVIGVALMGVALGLV